MRLEYKISHQDFDGIGIKLPELIQHTFAKRFIIFTGFVMPDTWQKSVVIWGCRILPSPWGADNTQKILDVLEKYNVRATFFVVGNWATQYPDTAQVIVDAGHEVMNHSNAHDHFNSLSADQIIADVTACNEKIEAITGVCPTLIRCPFGEYDDHVIAAIRSMGMEPIQWDVERYDIA